MEETQYQNIGCAVILLNGDKVLCVSRKNNHSDFGCPGGKIEPGETSEEGAIREVLEETGLRISHLRKIYSTYYEAIDQLAIAYLAEWEGDISTNEPHVVKWGSWDDLKSGSFGEFNQQTEKAILEMNAHEKKITVIEEHNDIYPGSCIHVENETSTHYNGIWASPWGTYGVEAEKRLCKPWEDPFAWMKNLSHKLVEIEEEIEPVPLASMTDLINIINNGWDIKITNQPKRIDGEFVLRLVWKARKGERVMECEWHGFEDAGEAIEDMVRNILK
jgi:8-oxo-dGTP pyrophosphatase MutT (NUDIX family)